MKVWVLIDYNEVEIVGVYSCEENALNALVDWIDEIIDDNPSMLEEFSREEWHRDAFSNNIEGIDIIEMTVQ